MKVIRAVMLMLGTVLLASSLGGCGEPPVQRAEPVSLTQVSGPVPSSVDWDTTTTAPPPPIVTTAAPAPPQTRPTVAKPPQRASRSQATSPPATATPAPPPAPVGDGSYSASCVGRKMSVGEAHACWDGLIAKYFPGQQGKAFGVMYCESTGNSQARGPRHPKYGVPTGLMQIMNGPTDPDANMALAAQMQRNRGWQPWACA